MIFVMDIGNTNIKAAVFDGERLLKRWRCATNLTMTSDQYGIIMVDLFRYHGLDMRSIAESVMEELFRRLAMHYDFSLDGLLPQG